MDVFWDTVYTVLTWRRTATLEMKRHWVRMQLRFEAPQDVKLEMLSRQAALSGNTSL